MKKDFIVSKIEAPEDGSPYVFVTFTDDLGLGQKVDSGEASTIYFSRRFNEKST